MNETKIRTVIVEDSPLYQMYLRRVLGADDQIAICGIAGTAAAAQLMVVQEHPDVITLDLRLPDMFDYQLLEEFVEKYPDIPIIVVTSTPESCATAIKLGASDFMVKVQDSRRSSLEQFAMLLKLKIKTQGTKYQRMRLKARLPPPPRKLRFEELADMDVRVNPNDPPDPTRYPQSLVGKSLKSKVIAIGASLGGTEATLEVLRLLPKAMPGIVVVQHMPPGFTSAYAMRLNKYCALEVFEAYHQALLRPGTVMVAPGGLQMKLAPAPGGWHRVKCMKLPPVNGFCPSVDTLFKSVARYAGADATGVILTGMGRDGAEGMLEMHDTGAYTIGQSQDSCAVYGMPAAARELGAVDIELSPEEIAAKLIAISDGYWKGRC